MRFCILATDRQTDEQTLIMTLISPGDCTVQCGQEKNLGGIRTSRSQVKVKVIFRTVQGHS